MKKNKAIALVFILLMVGSSIGAMVTSIFTKDEGVQLPNQNILKYKISDAQRKELLRKGFTLIEYDYPETCFDCETQKMLLESWAMQSEGQIYLQEGFSHNSETKVKIMSVKGSESLSDPTDDEIKENICEILLQRPFWCIEV